jgi:primosomal protein N' (replication factor Y) (superfamily II helicase)
MMAQVSGRAGRKHKQGKVIIQSRNPKHPVISLVIENDYEGMYELQIADRRKFNYPPYSRLVKISLKHKEPEPLNQAAAELARMLRKEFPKQILGPEYPMIPRIRNYYIKEILIKLRRDATLAASKEKIKTMLSGFLKTTTYKQLRLVVDVDPV